MMVYFISNSPDLSPSGCGVFMWNTIEIYISVYESSVYDCNSSQSWSDNEFSGRHIMTFMRDASFYLESHYLKINLQE